MRNATWCAPEVSALGGLRLFRMGATPLDWTAVATLLDGVPLLDPTLFEHAGRWWLLAARADAAPDTDLHAWHAPCPLGPWVPHGLNPVVSDVRAARPAGAVLRHAGALYRPGQDCAAGYGAAVVLHRILRLEPEAYSEVAVRRLEPGADWPWPDGLHTLNLIPGGLLIDAKRRVLTLRGR
ncbi:MAG: glucosamine inositolphosphorylceramide transferase family protein [Paracraurococcus sp.]